MCVATVSISTALIIGGVAAAGAGVAGAEISSNAAKKAAGTQANAADYSANLQAQLGQEGVNLDTEQLNAEEQNAYPFLQSGYGAEANLDYLMGIPVTGNYATGPTQFSTPGIPGVAPGTGGNTAGSSLAGVPGEALSALQNGGTAAPGTFTPNGTSGTAPLSSLVNPSLGAEGSLMQPFGQTFTPPTLAQAEQYPGYQFQLQQGLTALQNSAAAQGNLLTGQTQTAINNYAQNAAQTDYTNVYNQQLQQFQQAYNIYQNQQANEFNRLSALAGGGQTAAAQLSSAGNQQTGQVGNLLQGTGSNLSADYQNAAAAMASGYVGSANAINGGLSSLSNLAYLPAVNSMLNPSTTSQQLPPYSSPVSTTGAESEGIYSD
jgi:hypothetical protein